MCERCVDLAWLQDQGDDDLSSLNNFANRKEQFGLVFNNSIVLVLRSLQQHFTLHMSSI
jgi:hypothetical protein